MNTTRFIIFIVLLITTGQSCTKFTDVALPIDKVTSAQVFRDSSSAQAAVIGLYSQQVSYYYQTFLNPLVSTIPGMTADEFSPSVTSGDDAEFSVNAILSNNYTNYVNWVNAYAVVYQINTVLEHLDTMTNLSPDFKGQLLGEAHFLRALNYFYLTNEYGAVPLATTSDYIVNAHLNRSPSDTVYSTIIQDLSYARDHLPESISGFEKTRANRWAALALSARVALYRGDWPGAAGYATSVIGSGNFSLTDLDQVYLPGSSEALLQFVPSSTLNLNTNEGYYFIPYAPGVLPNYVLRNELLSSFEANDQRKIHWVGHAQVDGIDYAYPYKYKLSTGNPGYTKEEYIMVLRYAEMFLIRAEALAQQGRAADALSDLDVLRTRAGLPALASGNSAIDQPALLAFIYHEQQIEFFAEWGHRWFDLKRTGRATAVLAPVKGAGWSASDTLFPIPSYELRTNPQLTQNPGYF